MGFWTKAAGYGMMAGGAIGALYTGGATLPLVAAGANMVGNDEKKEGAEAAAEAEQAGIAKAIATQEQARDQNAAAFSPYTSTGSNAMNTLSHYMGLPAPTLGSPGGGVAKPMGGPVSPPAAGETPGTAVARQRFPTAGAATPQTQAIQQTASGYQPTLGGTQGGGLVQMRAPTGETRMVPRDQVAQFQQRGAVLLEGAA